PIATGHRRDQLSLAVYAERACHVPGPWSGTFRGCRDRQQSEYGTEPSRPVLVLPDGGLHGLDCADSGAGLDVRSSRPENRRRDLLPGIGGSDRLPERLCAQNSPAFPGKTSGRINNDNRVAPAPEKISSFPRRVGGSYASFPSLTSPLHCIPL